MNSINNIKLEDSLTYDFLTSMFRLNCNQKFALKQFDLDKKIKLNPDIVKWVENTRAILPDEIKELLDTYFSWESYFGLCLASLIPDLLEDNIEKFIVYIEDLSIEKIIQRFFNTGFGPSHEILTKKEVLSIINNEKKAAQFVEKNINLPSPEKYKLLQFIYNPIKMKENLIKLFKWHYQKVYKTQQNEVSKKINNYINNIEQKLDRYGYDYLQLLTKTDYSKDNNTDRIIFAFSYFYETSLFTSTSVENSDLYIIGYRYPELFVEKKHDILSNVELFKSLADETRLNIIKLLSNKTMYGHELAKKLDLSNATISYHISKLIANDLVNYEKKENRMYFSLNKDQFKSLLNQAVNRLFN